MNHKHKYLLTTFGMILALLFAGTWAFSQQEEESQRVSITLYKSLDKQPLDRQMVIAVKVEIEKGWHINSNAPNDEFLIPTSFDLVSEENFVISKIVYPDPLVLNLSFAEFPVSVFEGEFLIGAVIDLPDNLTVGEHEIPVELFYQACNDQTCEPPQPVNATLIFTVVDSDTDVKEINSDIFAKIKLF